MSKRWPAEWETHAATWMAWPERLQIWPHLEGAYKVYAAIANSIANHETLHMLVSRPQLAVAKKYLSASVNIIEASYDDSWTRDTMPLFLMGKGGLEAINWRFNAWGNKFMPHDGDAALGEWVCQQQGFTYQNIDMVLEGGSVHANGQGTVLTTAECLLNPNRNPHLSKTEIEKTVLEKLVCKEMVWLPYGVEGDVDTDGHIDNVACFLDADTLCIQSCNDPRDPNFHRHQKNLAVLANTRFKILEIPQPDAIFANGDERLPLSYLNFYFCNDAIVMPKFAQPKPDQQACEILQAFFPKRQIYQIDSLDLIYGGGGIHCITMQQPKAEG